MILFWKVYFANFLTSASGHPVFIPILNVAFKRAIDSSLSFSHGLRVRDPTATSSSFRPKYPRHFSPFPQKRRKKKKPVAIFGLEEEERWRRAEFPGYFGSKKKRKENFKEKGRRPLISRYFLFSARFFELFYFFKSKSHCFDFRSNQCGDFGAFFCRHVQ